MANMFYDMLNQGAPASTPGLFDTLNQNPMAALGLAGSLLGAAQAQPYGVSRGPMIGQAFQNYGTAVSNEQNAAMQKQLFEMKKKEFEAKQADAARKQQLIQGLFGGAPGVAPQGPTGSPTAAMPPGPAGQPTAPMPGVQQAGLQIQPKIDPEQKRQMALRAAAALEASDMPGLAGFYRDLAKPEKLMSVAPGGTVFDPATRTPVYTNPTKPDSMTKLGKLYKEQAALDPKDPRYAVLSQAYKLAIDKELSSNQLRVSVPTKDGLIEVSSGKMPAGQGGAMTNPSRTKVETKITELEDTMQSLDAIQASFEPQFATIGSQWDNWVAGMKDKAGFKLDPESQKELTKFSEWRAAAGRNFSVTLKALSGAAVTEPEMKRAEAWMINPGTGIIDGDGPVQVQAKLKNQRDFTRMAITRYKYYANQGISSPGAMGQATPLDPNNFSYNPKTGQRLMKVRGEWKAI